MNELDGVVGTRSPSGAGAFESSVLVLAACSDVAAIDEALLRPGSVLLLLLLKAFPHSSVLTDRFLFRRLQHHILLDKPSLGDVECIIRRAVERIPCAGDVDVARLGAVLVTCRPSCADAEALCQRALSLAIREEIAILEAGDTAEGRPDGGRQVRMEHFLSALSELTGFSEAHIAALEKQRATPFEWSGNFH